MIDIDILISPKDGSKLKIQNNKIIKDKNGTIFHVINGIPRFVSSDNYASSFGKQWNYFKSTQLDKYNGTNITEKRFFEDTHWVKDELKGQKVLEVGSGAGRFTQILLDYGAEVHSVDYSNAVDANLDNNGPNDKLYIYQADIYKLPFKEKLFDKVFCFGVLQHTPDVKAAFMDLIKFIKPVFNPEKLKLSPSTFGFVNLKACGSPFFDSLSKTLKNTSGFLSCSQRWFHNTRGRS